MAGVVLDQAYLPFPDLVQVSAVFVSVYCRLVGRGSALKSLDSQTPGEWINFTPSQHDACD